MNGLRRIVIWTLIPVALECLGLLFIDKVYLNATTTFNAQKVDINAKKKTNKINVKVPENAKQIGVSYKGNYVSYLDEDTIFVVDTSNNKKKEIKVPDGGKVSFYKWVEDTDRMIIAEKFIEDGSCYFKFESYDAKKDSKNPISDETQKNESRKELKMTLLEDNYEVKDMVESSATGVIHIWLSKNGEKNRIFHINRMIQKEEVKIGDAKVSKMFSANKEDKLIYEDRSSNRIRVTGSRNPIATGENAMHYLLGVDGEDTVYIGNGDNGKINKIFAISLKKGKVSDKTQKLEVSVNKNDIYISRNGKIYTDNGSGKVTEFGEQKEIQYPGKIIGVYNFGILSQKDGKVIGTLFEN